MVELERKMMESMGVSQDQLERGLDKGSHHMSQQDFEENSIFMDARGNL